MDPCACRLREKAFDIHLMYCLLLARELITAALCRSSTSCVSSPRRWRHSWCRVPAQWLPAGRLGATSSS